jgi:O-antigen ligase
MWKAAWLMTEDSKFLGVGEAQYHTNLEKLIKECKVYKDLDDFSAPHSQYFNSLSEQGVVGLLSFFLMILTPLRMGISKISKLNLQAYLLPF